MVLFCVVALIDDQQIDELEGQEGVLQQIHADLPRHHHHLAVHQAVQAGRQAGRQAASTDATQ